MNLIEIVLGILLIFVVIKRPLVLKNIVISEIGRVVFALSVLYLVVNHGKNVGVLSCLIFVVMINDDILEGLDMTNKKSYKKLKCEKKRSAEYQKQKKYSQDNCDLKDYGEYYTTDEEYESGSDSDSSRDSGSSSESGSSSDSDSDSDYNSKSKKKTRTNVVIDNVTVSNLLLPFSKSNNNTTNRGENNIIVPDRQYHHSHRGRHISPIKQTHSGKTSPGRVQRHSGSGTNAPAVTPSTGGDTQKKIIGNGGTKSVSFVPPKQSQSTNATKIVSGSALLKPDTISDTNNNYNIYSNNDCIPGYDLNDSTGKSLCGTFKSMEDALIRCNNLGDKCKAVSMASADIYGGITADPKYTSGKDALLKHGAWCLKSKYDIGNFNPNGAKCYVKKSNPNSSSGKASATAPTRATAPAPAPVAAVPAPAPVAAVPAPAPEPVPTAGPATSSAPAAVPATAPAAPAPAAGPAPAAAVVPAPAAVVPAPAPAAVSSAVPPGKGEFTLIISSSVMTKLIKFIDSSWNGRTVRVALRFVSYNPQVNGINGDPVLSYLYITNKEAPRRVLLAMMATKGVVPFRKRWTQNTNGTFSLVLNQKLLDAFGGPGEILDGSQFLFTQYGVDDKGVIVQSANNYAQITGFGAVIPQTDYTTKSNAIVNVDGLQTGKSSLNRPIKTFLGAVPSSNLLTGATSLSLSTYNYDPVKNKDRCANNCFKNNNCNTYTSINYWNTNSPHTVCKLYSKQINSINPQKDYNIYSDSNEKKTHEFGYRSLTD